MIFVDVHDPLVGDVGCDYFFRMLKMQHFEEQESIYRFLCHGLFPSNPDSLDLIGIFGVQLLLFLFAGSGDLHRVKDDLAHRERLLVNGGELVIHLKYYEEVIYIICVFESPFILFFLCLKECLAMRCLYR
jgi:hypothetical protein